MLKWYLKADDTSPIKINPSFLNCSFSTGVNENKLQFTIIKKKKIIQIYLKSLLTLKITWGGFFFETLCIYLETRKNTGKDYRKIKSCLLVFLEYFLEYFLKPIHKNLAARDFSRRISNTQVSDPHLFRTWRY